MKPTISMAAMATLHCLTGCAIGEITGMVISSAAGWGNVISIILSFVLAFVFGYGLTIYSLTKSSITFVKAIKIALAADTVSILTMEIVDNGFIIVVPGALNAGLLTVLFWVSLIISLVIAFIVTVPVNYWLISRGKGHALRPDHQHNH